MIGPYKRTVRVFYPLQNGRIVLRTEADWEHNIDPTSSARIGESLSLFSLQTTLFSTSNLFSSLATNLTGWAGPTILQS
jgi:hypothetical protein